MFEHFRGLLPDENSVLTLPMKKLLGKIRNDERVPRRSEMAEVRWQTTAYATNTQLESPETEKLLKARCMVQVAV